MKLIDQSFRIIEMTRYPMELIEEAGRTCYKSGEKITKDSADKFVSMLISRGHHSVLEHASATVKIITNRGVTHELVRHRLASFSQESTRYVKYGDGMEFITPVWYGENVEADNAFWWACNHASKAYQKLIGLGWRPEQAREILPNSLKTEIIVTANMREWRHIMELRTSPKAHPQIRDLMNKGLQDFKSVVPGLFKDFI